MMEKFNYDMLDNESLQEYKERIYSYKENAGITWFEIANIINEHTGLNYSESYYRKEYKRLQDCTEHPYADKEESIFTKIKKERVKLSDERIQNNAYIRALAREETLKEIALEVATEVSVKLKLPDVQPKKYSNQEREAILEISDWHYGIEIDSYWNKYNPDICQQRVEKLARETIDRCKFFGINILHVVNLGDLIAGRIHLQLRLASRYDTITQIINVTEILTQFLNILVESGLEVHYYDCYDNHSRIEPNKKESIKLETLARMTPWYLKARLGDRVVFHENKYSEDIISFQLLGHNVAGVHGDLDKPNKVVKNISALTRSGYDLILTAHYHHFAGDEENQCIVVSNSSLMGTDDYAQDLRLSATASQNLIIVTKDNQVDDISRIVLN